jgi:hypothetical protein
MSNPEEEIKIQKRESILEKRRIINKFYKHIDNKSFLEMKRTLDEYYLELEEGIRENKKVENENFKKHFFSSLEDLLNNVALIKEESKIDQRIEDVFKWFKKRKAFFQNISTITARTSNNTYEKFPDFDPSKKSNYYEAGEYPLFFESKHRTEDDGLMPPKDR